MTSPLVSIVIPCFNGADLIGAAIESSLAQAYSNIEVIVIDDGSTDQSLAVIKSFGERIRWETGPNQGGCAARNRGWELAKGTYVQFLDADDVLLPEKLLRQVPVAEKHCDKLSYCDHVLIEDDGSSQKRSCGVKWDDPLEFVLCHLALTTIAPLHRKDWLRKVGGFRIGLKASQELDLHLRLAASGVSFFHIPEALFTVRRRPMSVSHNSAFTMEQWISFFPELIDALDFKGDLTRNRRAVLASHLSRAARLVLRDGSPVVGRQLFQLAVQLDPRAADRSYGPITRRLKSVIGPLNLERLVKWLRPNIVLA
jgi:glycosyltransferase involved in cell wall biosynthesis